jgi:hypothetical protein
MNKMINISLPLIYSAYNEDIYVISSNKKWNSVVRSKNKNIIRQWFDNNIRG